MTLCRTRRHTQRGNVLFLILIAVALFAALSFAISSSLRSGDTNASVEQRSAAAAQILQYVTGLRSAVQRLVLNGCAENQLSFEPPPFSGSGAYFNPNSPTNFSCHVFHNNGGGQSAWTYLSRVQGQGVYGPYSNPIYNATWGISRIGNNRGDLTMILGITDGNLCREINQRIGVNNPGGQPPHRNGDHIHAEFNGTFSDPYPGWADWSSVSGGDTTLDPGHMEACMNYFDRDPNLYVFYAVLLPR